MSSLCIRSSRYLLRTLGCPKVCAFMPPVRQMSRVDLYVRRLHRVCKLVGVSSCVAAGAGLVGSLVLSSPDLMKLHAKAVDGEAKVPNQWNFIADVVEKVSPAVVYIEIEGRNPFTRQAIPISNGSGFIVREDGIILTNAHVVGDNHTVRVKLDDGRSFDGFVQAVDPVSDLATVKINASRLPTLTLGKSSELRPGEWVVAVGSPFKLSNTVTAGIVSSVQRGSRELGLYSKNIDYIQTDANINFGNSGGPLINLAGEAIGINTMKVTAGISFAIPSDYAKVFLEKASTIEQRLKCRESQTVVAAERKSWFGAPAGRRYIGITMVSLNPSISAQLKMINSNLPDVDEGVLVYRVIHGSPAYNSGVRAGDVITAIDGSRVMSSSDVYKAVDSAKSFELTIIRVHSPSPISLTVTPEPVDQ